MGCCCPEYKFLSAAQLLRLFTNQAVVRNAKDENSFQACLMMSIEDENGISCTQRSSATALLKVFFFLKTKDTHMQWKYQMIKTTHLFRMPGELA